MMSPSLERAIRRAVETEDLALRTLERLVAQPSISARNEGMGECFALVRGIMEDAGIHTDLLQTDGFPVVYGEMPGPPGAPTILFYGHYDVQPPEPLESWVTPPFQATVRDGRIYGRGVADNKGQFLCHIWAIQTWRQAAGELPLSVKFLIEGEEETGSPHLEAVAREHSNRLRADLVLTADGGMDASDRPTVYFGARGMLYAEIEVRGAATDAHSGRFGNVLPEPAWELVHILAALRDDDGRVRLPGFYEAVRPPSAGDAALLRAIPSDPSIVLRQYGVTPNIPDAHEYGRRLAFEPTFNIAGLHSGYAGQGMKTIIPSAAMAKIDLRLVVDQEPDPIFEALVGTVAGLNPRAQVRKVAAVRPSRTDPTLPISRALVNAVREASGQEPVVVPVFGGTLPDYVFTRVIGVPSAVVPYANHDEQNHAPNENLRLDCFRAGIRTTLFVLDAFGQMQGERAGGKGG